MLQPGPEHHERLPTAELPDGDERHEDHRLTVIAPTVMPVEIKPPMVETPFGIPLAIDPSMIRPVPVAVVCRCYPANG